MISLTVYNLKYYHIEEEKGVSEFKPKGAKQEYRELISNRP